MIESIRCRVMCNFSRLVKDLHNTHLSKRNSIDFQRELRLYNSDKPFRKGRLHKGIDKLSMRSLQDKSLEGNFEHMNSSKYRDNSQYCK